MFALISVHSTDSKSGSVSSIVYLRLLSVSFFLAFRYWKAVASLQGLIEVAGVRVLWHIFLILSFLQVKEHVKDSFFPFPHVLVSQAAVHRRWPPNPQSEKRAGRKAPDPSLLPNWNDFHSGYTCAIFLQVYMLSPSTRCSSGNCKIWKNWDCLGFVTSPLVCFFLFPLAWEETTVRGEGFTSVGKTEKADHRCMK